ncbi:MAG: fasciclin domain-containing protein [Patescibacteria group bacterium]
MDNKVIIIGGVAVILLGGALYLGSQSDPTPADVTITERDAMDNELNEMDTETNTEESAVEPMESPATTNEVSDPMDNEAAAGADIVATAADTESLSTLVTAVTAAELVTTLQGEGPFTVFAPTNAAFDALPAGTLDTLLMSENQADLQAVLAYHVVPGSYTAADLTSGMTLETVSGETITVTTSESGVTLNDNATVATADVMTSNGVVHIIDAVLLPGE